MRSMLLTSPVFYRGSLLSILTAIVLVASQPAWAKSPVAAVPATYTKDIAPIMFAQCANCHRPGEGAPFNLLTYDETREHGELIASVTKAKTMPPWHADVGDVPLRDERRLTDEQIATIGRWVSAGMPPGEAKDLPPTPKFTPGWQLGEPDLIVKMPTAFHVPAEGPDLYRNFAIPMNLDQDRWVKAVEFRPSAPNVVHHTLFFLDPTGKASQTEGFSRLTVEGGGLSGLNGLANRTGERAARPGLMAALGEGTERGPSGLGGWAVGATPVPMPDGLAYRVRKGSDLILSTHFHPSGKAESEQSTLGIYFAKEPPTRAFTGIQLPPMFGALSGVNIPAGESNYEKRDSFTLPNDVEAFGVSCHAHYLGKSMLLTATFPDGKTLQLLKVSNFDFNWQEQYLFEEFVKLPKGTRLDAIVAWDNSAENPRNPSHPPVAVRWGRESTEEMGSITLRVVPKRNSELSTITTAYKDHIRETVMARLTATGRGEGSFDGAALRKAIQERRNRKNGGVPSKNDTGK